MKTLPGKSGRCSAEADTAFPSADRTGFLGNKSPTYKTLQGHSCCPYKMIVAWCGVKAGGGGGGSRRGHDGHRSLDPGQLSLSVVSEWGVRVSGLVMSQVLQSSALGLLLPAPV